MRVCRPANGASGRGKRGPKGPVALQKMISFLLPLVGKRIFIMLVLAVARTALSNRLARMQAMPITIWLATRA